MVAKKALAVKNRRRTATPAIVKAAAPNMTPWPELVEQMLLENWCLDVGKTGDELDRVGLKHASPLPPKGVGAFVAGFYRLRGERAPYARGASMQEAIEKAVLLTR